MTSAAGLPPLPPRKRKSGMGWFAKSFLFLVLLLLLGAFGYAGYLYYEINQAIEDAGSDAPAAQEQPAKGKPTTMLLLGTDTREETGSLNTDVIMIASLNPERKSATLVSIPRDTYVKLNGVRAGKANAFYANFYAADKKTADQKTKDLFGKYMNVKIDHIAKIDFKGFEEIVDTLGGLTIDVDMDMCYRDKEDGTDINLTKGVQTLNGDQTLDFVRYRKSNCRHTAESNDMQRNERQQQVIGKMVDKLKSFGGILKLAPIIESVGRNVKTDIPSSQIKSMIGTYLGIDRDKIKYIHLEGDWESPYVMIKPEEVRRAQSALQEQLK